MTGITHKQAGRYMRADLDGLLTAAQHRDLIAHLDECSACRLESESFSLLTARLKNNFQARWDTQYGPSQNVMANVQSQTRRIIMKKRIDFAFNLLGGAAALLVLFFVVTSVISQFQKKSTPAANETQTSFSSPQNNNSLIAFTSKKDGNAEIYTMHADGSELTNLTKDPANDSVPFWSPDGKRIAFESDRDGSAQIYLMDADGSNVIQLTHGEGDYHLDAYGYRPWSPDGSKLIISHASPGDEIFFNLYVMDIADTSTTALTNEPGEYILSSWSSDGTHVAFISAVREKFSADLYVVASDGSHLVKLTETLPAGEYFSRTYDWSPDGNSIFVATHRRNEQGNQDPTYIVAIYAVNVDGSVISTLMKSADAQTIDWQNGVDVRLDSANQTLSWIRPDGSQSTLKVCQNGDQISGITFKRSHAGNFVFGSNCFPNGWTLYWSNPDGTAVKPLLHPTIPSYRDSVFNLTWSPDDQHIAFVSVDFTSSDLAATLYVLDVAKAQEDPTVQPLKLANSAGQDWQPVSNGQTVKENPTPEPTQTDNRLLAFTSEKDGNAEIYTMHPDGSGLINLTNNPALDANPVWSLDGKRIAFESDRTGFRQIFLMNADGSNVNQLSNDEADQWIGEPYNLSLNLWSPDGKKLIFSQIVPGKENGMLYIIDANGENKKPLVNEAGKYSSPSWSPDGKHIAFLVLENDVTHIYSTDADGNNLTHVTKNLPLDETLYPVNYSWSRDGQSISFIASNWNQLLGGGGGGEGSPNYNWSAYEAGLDGNTLVTNASTRSQIGGYWDGTYFLSGSALVTSFPAFTWVHQKGTTTTFNPLMNCENLLDENTGSSTAGYSSYKQSSNGNVMIGAYCPNGDKWLYWANSKGTVRPLLDTPIHVEGTTVNAMHLWAPPDFVWSLDDKYIAFHIFSQGKTDMHIVNVAEALKDPSVQPFQMTIGNGSLYYSPSWQPIINNDIVEEKPTSEPLAISLTVQESEMVAGVDAFETSLIGFNMFNPSYLPEGYVFQEATYDSYTQTVILTYASPLADPIGQGTIHIYQKRGDFPKETDLPSYATPVPVGDVLGEFTHGAWIYESGATTSRWDGSADYYSLSWQKDGISFMVDFIGGEGIPNIQLNGLRDIAESLK